MTYIEIVKESIEYIEKNLNTTLSLEELASTFYITKYHYSRIFKAVTGKSIMNYYKQRKFSKATDELINSEKNILEIAFDYGYNSQEAFSRAYKKEMNYTPKLVKNGTAEIETTPKFIVIEREFKNYKNAILSNHKIIEKQETIFWGRRVSVNFESFENERAGMKTVEDFIKETKDLKKFYVFTFMTTAVENTLDLGMYILDNEKNKAKGILEKIILPKANYLEIEYKGKMQESWLNVSEDIKMILKNKQIERDKRLVNFYQEFKEKYRNKNIYKVYVPLK